MVDIIEREAVLQAFDRVETVRLEIGMLSCTEPDALRFCFDTATKGTVADGARREIIAVPARVLCQDCGAEATVERWGAGCPACDGYSLKIRGGDQMRIKDLEVQ
jgi:hydrogenase nickel incorporation protein HypA/HybF